MKLRKNVAISDSGFIFNPGSGDSFSTNPLGLEIINLLKEGNSISDIEKKVAQKYHIDDNTLAKDLEDFIQVLLNNQLAEDK